MENLDQQSVGQDASVVALRVQLGELLKRERLSQQKDAMDVARRLMLSKLQLVAIETGESASFHHERRYIQGIKSYVFYLGLQSRHDVSTLVTQIENWSAQDLQASPAAGVAQLHRSATAPAQIKSYATRGVPRYVYYGLAFLIVGAVALAISEGWPFKQSTQEAVLQEPAQVTSTVSAAASPTSTNVPPVQTQAPAQVAPQSAPVAQIQPPKSEPEPEKIVPKEKTAPVVSQDDRGMMRIDFIAECWVSMQMIQGGKQERIYKPGDSLSVPLASVGSIVLGNAPAAKVFLSGKQVDVLTKGFTTGNVARLDQKSLQTLQKN